MELYNHIAVNDFANREPEFEYTQTATLSKIVYPTGGSTEFFYEPNEYDNNENEQRTEEYSIPNVAYAVDGHRHIESEEFEITNPFLNVSIEVNLKRPKDCSYSTDIPNCREISNEIFYVQLIGVGNYSDGLPNNTCQVWSIYDAETLKNVKDYFELKPGTYKLISNIPSCGGASDYDSFAEISVYYKKMVDIPEKSIGGGLRINKIVDNDPINPTKKQIRAYKYYQGKLMSPPSFMRNIHFPEQKFVIETDKGPIEMSSPETTIYNLYSYSNLPLSSSASGSFVGYNLVEEWQGENAENGKTIYEYHNQPDKLINPMCGDLVSRFFNIPTISDPLNGLLMHKTVLNSALKTTYELINLYTEELAEGSILNPIRNRQIYWGYLFEFFGYADFSPLCSHTILHQYPIFSQKVELEKTIEKTYDSNSNNYVTTTKEYIYNNDRLLQSQSEIASDGSNITTKFKYPLDYKKEAMGLVGGKYILEEMVNKNIINPTIEKQVLKSNELISSEVTKYNFFGDSKQFILPKEVYVLETNKPLTSTTYKEIKDVDGKYQDAVPDLDFWKEKMSLNYDSYANLVSQQKTKGIPTSYIWGYNNTLPVAKIVGVSCDDISLQTGKSCTEYDETNVESLRDNEYLKKEAMITTYKYEPLKGMTSAIDENGKVTHYDYDDLGRLEFIKDNELNVLKKYIYHYAGQPIVK
jgi:YD repeat-containing protein